MPEITLYSKTVCPQCTASKRKFDKLGITYRELNVDHDEAAAQFLRDAGYTQAPVVITSEGEEWTGFRPDLIEALAARLEAGNG